MSATAPYRPPWYPNRDPYHNPWAIAPWTVQEGGRTFYDEWTRGLEEGELAQLVAATR